MNNIFQFYDYLQQQQQQQYVYLHFDLQYLLQ